MKCKGTSLRGHHKQAKEGVFLAAVFQLQHFGDSYSVCVPPQLPHLHSTSQASQEQGLVPAPSFGWRSEGREARE